VATTNKQRMKAATRISQEGTDGGVGVGVLGPIAADPGHGRGGGLKDKLYIMLEEETSAPQQAFFSEQ
jgi:hypothetical protein